MKKKEALFRAIGGVGDDLIARAEQPVSKKNTVWLRWTAMPPAARWSPVSPPSRI